MSEAPEGGVCFGHCGGGSAGRARPLPGATRAPLHLLPGAMNPGQGGLWKEVLASASGPSEHSGCAFQTGCLQTHGTRVGSRGTSLLSQLVFNRDGVHSSLLSSQVGLGLFGPLSSSSPRSLRTLSPFSRCFSIFSLIFLNSWNLSLSSDKILSTLLSSAAG